MSMSCIVFSSRHLETVAQWQAAIDELGCDLKLDGGEDSDILSLRGHLPAAWNGIEAGFECYPGGVDEVAETVEVNSDFDFGGPWTCLLDLYYMGHANVAGTMIAAAAYAAATGGIVWESEGGDILDATAAIAFARKTAIEVRQALVDGAV